MIIMDLKYLHQLKINYSYIFKGDTKETGGDLALTIDNEDLFIVKLKLEYQYKNFRKR